MTRKLTWALLLLGVLAGLCSLAYPRMQLDSSAATYTAIVILEGGAPYRDAWDIRAPGISFAYAAGIFMFGRSAVGLRAFDFLWQGCTALVLFVVARRIYGSPETALLAGFLYFLTYFTQNYPEWAQPDGLLNLPMALFLLFALRATQSDKTFQWFLSALFVGIAALFKLPFGLVGIALIVLACRQAPGTPLGILRRLVALASGVATPLFLCAVFLYARGALGDALTTEFVFTPEYVAQIHRAIHWQRILLNTFGRLGLAPYFILLVVALGSLARQRQAGERLGREQGVMWWWFVTGMATLFLNGSFYHHHFLSQVPPLVLLSAPALANAMTGFRGLPTSARFRAAVLLVALFMPSVQRIGQHAVFTANAIRGQRNTDSWTRVSQYIQERSSPSDKIFVWGNVPLVYLLSERKAASRFLPTTFISLSVPGTEYRRVLLEELHRNSPKFIVVRTQGATWADLPNAEQSFQQFESLREFVRARYRVDLIDENFVLFVRKD